MDLPFIFDKFFRASNAAGEASGTGLGLAIVKSIVETIMAALGGFGDEPGLTFNLVFRYIRTILNQKLNLCRDRLDKKEFVK